MSDMRWRSAQDTCKRAERMELVWLAVSNMLAGVAIWDGIAYADYLPVVLVAGLSLAYMLAALSMRRKRLGLEALIAAAKRRRPMSEAELDEQKISWVYGNMRLSGSTITKEQLREILKRQRSEAP